MSEDHIHPVEPAWKARAHIDNDTYLAMYAQSISDPDIFWAERADELRLFCGVRVTAVGQQRLALEPERFQTGFERVVVEPAPRTGDVLVALGGAFRLGVGNGLGLGGAETNDTAVRLGGNHAAGRQEPSQQQNTQKGSMQSLQTSSPGRSGPLRSFPRSRSSADRSGDRDYSLG